MMLVHEGHDRARQFFTPANAESYDLVSLYATFGRDRAWKRQVVEAISRNEQVLELACGTGILSSMLANSGKSVIGLDITFDYLTASRKKIIFPVTQGTAEKLPYRGECFDAVVSSYLAKYANTDDVAQECMRVLRPRGRTVFHDFARPPNPIMRRLWKTYFSVLRFCGFFIPSWKAVFDQLDSVIENSDWEVRIIQSLRRSGFIDIDRRYLTAGTSSIITATKP